LAESEARARTALQSPQPAPVRGRLLYVLAADTAVRGEFTVALTLVEEAQSELERIRDSEGSASAYQMSADVLRALGEREQAWKDYRRALALIEAGPPSIRRHALLTTIALA